MPKNVNIKHYFGRTPKFHLFSCFIILSTITACSEITDKNCRRNDHVSVHELADLAISRLAKETQGPLPHIIRYANATEFREKNPSCCFVQEPKNYSGDPLEIPMESQVSLALIYKKTDDTKSLTVRYVNFGECPTEMDHTEKNISESQFQRTKWGWRIK